MTSAPGASRGRGARSPRCAAGPPGPAVPGQPRCPGLPARTGGLRGHAADHAALDPAGTGLPARQFPLLIETAAAAAIGVVTRSPFGEPERGTGRWLPVLRLGAAVALTAAAFGALAAGSAAAHLDYGYLGLLRDLAGMTGIALLAAAVVGGSLCWIGPLGYWMLAAYAIGPGLDHALGLAGPAAARSRRGTLRGAGIRRRHSGRHGTRRPRLRPPVTPAARRAARLGEAGRGCGVRPGMRGWPALWGAD